MKSLIPVTQSELTRQERLLIWQRRTGRTALELSLFAKVTKITASRWMRADSLPWYRVQVMRDFGIPEELLPESEGEYRGPQSLAEV